MSFVSKLNCVGQDLKIINNAHKKIIMVYYEC